MCARREYFDDRRPQRGDQGGNVLQLVAGDALLQIRKDGLRRFDADIGQQQAALELFEDLRIDLAAAEQVGQIVGEPGIAAIELGAQAPEEALFSSGFAGLAGSWPARSVFV